MQRTTFIISHVYVANFQAPGTLQDLEETPAVKNDYYMAEFLLTLPAAGQYVLKIDNNLVDHEGKIWHTGPRYTYSHMTISHMTIDCIIIIVLK